VGAGSFAGGQWPKSTHVTVDPLHPSTRVVDQISAKPAITRTYDCAALALRGEHDELGNGPIG
jgi:hypothetical protein